MRAAGRLLDGCSRPSFPPSVWRVQVGQLVEAAVRRDAKIGPATGAAGPIGDLHQGKSWAARRPPKITKGISRLEAVVQTDLRDVIGHGHGGRVAFRSMGIEPTPGQHGDLPIAA